MWIPKATVLIWGLAFRGNMVYIGKYIYACIHIYVYIHMYIYMCIHIYIHIHIYVYTIYIYTHTHTHTHTLTHTHIYLYTYISYIYVYIYIYISVVPTVFVGAYWCIYLICTSVKLKRPHHSWELCQKIFYNLEYLEWLEMHFPASSKVFLQTF